MTRSAGLMLRELGLALYLGCLGLSAGGQFFETVVRPEGLMWVGIGFLITVVPVIIVGFIILKTKKYDFGSICGKAAHIDVDPRPISPHAICATAMG